MNGSRFAASATPWRGDPAAWRFVLGRYHRRDRFRLHRIQSMDEHRSPSALGLFRIDAGRNHGSDRIDVPLAAAAVDRGTDYRPGDFPPNLFGTAGR